MDTLALLCNLHADGPTSLAKLRAAGCRTLAELDTLSLRDLGKCLGEDVARAQRFLREAGCLALRVGDDDQAAPRARATERARANETRAERARASDTRAQTNVLDAVLERDAVHERMRAHAHEHEHEHEHAVARVRDAGDVAGPFAAPHQLAAATSHAPQQLGAATPGVSEPDAALAHDEASRDDAQSSRRDHYALQPLKDAVLRVWREQDRLDPPPQWTSAPSPRATVAATAAAHAGAAESELAHIDGLDALARQALAAAGIHNGAEFLAADPIELVARTGLAYSALNRWRFLLRRGKAAAPGGAAPAH